MDSVRKQLIAKAFRRNSQDYSKTPTSFTPRPSPFQVPKRLITISPNPSQCLTPKRTAPLIVPPLPTVTPEPGEISRRIFSKHVSTSKPLPFVIFECYIAEICTEMQKGPLNKKLLHPITEYRSF